MIHRTAAEFKRDFGPKPDIPGLVQVVDISRRRLCRPGSTAGALAIDIAARGVTIAVSSSLMEAALGMAIVGLDRDHHAGFERPVSVVVVVGTGPVLVRRGASWLTSPMP